MFRQAQHDKGKFEFYRLNHQADNLAKLRQGFLSVTELIAKIFGAVSRTKAVIAALGVACFHAMPLPL